jgi:glutamine amidotransferase
MKNVVIVDCQLGNLFSVQRACQSAGSNVRISNVVSDVKAADALILPGVGAFNAAMNNLASLNLLDPILSHVSVGKPIFGVCLGLQLLFEGSEEFGFTPGLGVLRGHVKKLKISSAPVPQIGWNSILPPIKTKRKWNETPLNGIVEGVWMYFVHSYYVDNIDNGDSLCETEYGGFRYTTGVMKNNIFGVQFHPEKSSETGLLIYRNWLEMVNK